MDIVSIINEFGYHKPDREAADKISEVRALFIMTALAVSALPACDDRKKSLDHLRTAAMYAVGSIVTTTSPVVIDEFDDDLVKHLFMLIVGSDELPSRTVMLDEIKAYINRSGITWAM